VLILIAGLPGSGKTSLATAFAKRYGASHFNSDQIRRELGLWGSYRDEDKAAVYNELLARTRRALASGETVVVDSTFYRASLRNPFELVAAQLGQKPLWVLATAPDEVLRQRVAKPRADSEANEAVLEKIKAEFEPLEPPFLTIDTSSGSAEELAEAIDKHIHHG
jgi:predicted kinase